MHDDVWADDLQVSDAADAERAADTLAGVIVREAVPFAESLGTLEKLLAELGYGEEGRVDERLVALLAAAGRFDDARTALGRNSAETGDRRCTNRERSRFVHQVGRYIDNGGDPSIVPSQPPPNEHGTVEGRSVSEIWHESRAQRAAVRAVRAMGPETDRSELRATLERELAARGVSESPLWLERTLDHLDDSPAEQARSVAEGVGSAADLALRAIRGLREHRSRPDLSPPTWLDPPDRAVDPVAKNPQARWTEVQLNEQAASYLGRAYDAIPRLIGSTALATAWLSWDEGPHQRLVVSLGDQRVGTVTPAATAAYRPVMDRATERDELPYVPARLTPRSETHLLEIQLPDRRA